MKIVKLHKPQRMSNWESVIAYSSEEDEENPDALADAEAAANADSTTATTDSTRVSFGTTPRGVEGTVHFPGGRTTIRVEGRSPIGVTEDSTYITQSYTIPGTNITITSETALANDGDGGSVLAPPGYIVPGQVEYDTLGRILIH